MILLYAIYFDWKKNNQYNNNNNAHIVPTNDRIIIIQYNDGK